jgi:hypothetical protein
MQKEYDPSGPLAHLFREPVLTNNQSFVIKYEERWETI